MVEENETTEAVAETPEVDAEVTDEETTETAEDFLGEPTQKVVIGPHPLGGIRLGVWDRGQGRYVEQRIDLPESSMLLVHLQALVTMTFQTIYAQQAQIAQQAKSGLIVPGQ